MISSYIAAENQVLGDCHFRDVLKRRLKVPLFNVVVRKGGKTLIEGAAGFLTVEHREFLLDVVLTHAEAAIRGMGLVKQVQTTIEQPSGGQNDASFVSEEAPANGKDSKSTRFVPELEPLGTLRSEESHGYVISATTLKNERFQARTLDASSSCHVDGQWHWAGRLREVELWRDDGPAFDSLAAAGRLPKRPRGVATRVTAVLVGRYHQSAPSEGDFKVDGRSFHYKRSELKPNVTLLTVEGDDDREAQTAAVDLLHEAYSFFTGQFLPMLGRAWQCDHASGVLSWSHAIDRMPITGYEPIRSSDGLRVAFELFLAYFGDPQRSETRDVLRKTIARKVYSGDQYFPIQEFVLYTALERLTDIIKTSPTSEKKKSLKELKEAVIGFLDQLESQDPELTDRMKVYLQDMKPHPIRLKFMMLFERFGLDWDPSLYRAWTEMRNPSAHGRVADEIDQSRVDHFHRCNELWHALILSELGYNGPIVGYSQVGFPESDRLCVASIA